MNIEMKNEGEVLCVKLLNNTINSFTSLEFKNKILELILKGNHTILIDFSNIDFVDSKGISAIISILKFLSQHKGSIAICSMKEPVKDLFLMTGMNRILNIYKDEKEGIQSLNTEINE